MGDDNGKSFFNQLLFIGFIFVVVINLFLVSILGTQPYIDFAEPYIDRTRTFVTEIIEIWVDDDEIKVQEIDIDNMRENVEEVEYDELLRFPDTYEETIIETEGVIAQSLSDNSYRVYINEGEYGWEDDVYLDFRMDKSREKLKEIGKLLEDDKIIFLGKFKGIKSGTTIFGENRDIPEIVVYEFDLISKRE